MSATNRGAEREILDQYPTPFFAIEAFLKNYDITNLSCIDPCSGAGNIIKVSQSLVPSTQWAAVELDSKYSEDLYSKVQNNFIIHDFLNLDIEKIKNLNNGKNFDLVLTNPPYILAQEFVLKSFQIADKVSMLLRLNFLASRKRVSFMQKHAPDVYVLPKRPSFKKTAKSSTDACDYGWFVWDSKIERASGNIYFLNV